MSIGISNLSSQMTSTVRQTERKASKWTPQLGKHFFAVAATLGATRKKCLHIVSCACNQRSKKISCVRSKLCSPGQRQQRFATASRLRSVQHVGRLGGEETTFSFQGRRTFLINHSLTTANLVLSKRTFVCLFLSFLMRGILCLFFIIPRRDPSPCGSRSASTEARTRSRTC